MPEEEPKPKKEKPLKLTPEQILELMNKGFQSINKQLEEIKGQQAPSVLPLEPARESQAVFLVVEMYMTPPPKNPEELEAFKKNTEAFRKELEPLMKKFKVGQLSAVFLHKFQ